MIPDTWSWYDTWYLIMVWYLYAIYNPCWCVCHFTGFRSHFDTLLTTLGIHTCIFNILFLFKKLRDFHVSCGQLALVGFSHHMFIWSKVSSAVTPKRSPVVKVLKSVTFRNAACNTDGVSSFYSPSSFCCTCDFHQPALRAAGRQWRLQEKVAACVFSSSAVFSAVWPSHYGEVVTGRRNRFFSILA